jgi:hypothetical protein
MCAESMGTDAIRVGSQLSRTSCWMRFVVQPAHVRVLGPSDYHCGTVWQIAWLAVDLFFSVSPY